MATKYTYDKKKDYQAMINEAVGSGDYQSAALYEQQRNQKIADMNATGTNAKGHQQTNLYSKFLNGGSDTAQGYITGLASAGKPDTRNYDAWQDALNQYQNAKFEYDFDGDPQKQAYERNAQKNYEDTLAQTSARTGGLASSYAGQASQQAYQDTMSEAYQILYNLARNDFDAEQQKKLNVANQYWNAYQSDLDLSNTDWNRLYSLYGLTNDREMAAAEAEKEAATMAAYGGDYARLAAAYGITEEQAKAYLNAASGTSSGGSGSAKSTGTESAKVEELGIVDTMLGFGNDTRAYEYLVKLGYTNGITENLWELYQSAKDGQDTQATQTTQTSAGRVTLPDTGDKVSFAEALRLVEAGDYVVTGYDSDGNPRLAVSAQKGTKITGYTK